MADTSDYRLPRSVVPQRYCLELAPDLESASFTGTMTVALRVDEPVDRFVCNATELEVTSARLEWPGGNSADGQVHLDADEQRAVVAFDRQVDPGEGYLLHMAFSGTLNDKLRGFYRSTFTTTGGDTAIVACTHFEPQDARRAFPCWDEPDFKATFAVTLVVPDHLTALSNGPAVEETPAGPGLRRVAFAETIAMSTYLVAFIVGPFELTDPVSVDGVDLRVAAAPGKAHLAGFAAEAGSHALRFLSQYFELPYPADKIDHVAIPDFAFGAMENLGCVTYRETALLVDPATASQLELQRVASVVAHETAHMWFGDLVTMKWWNGIWLNEAFATFMEMTTTEAFRPDWDVWTAFGAGKAAAMVTDGLAATRPVEYAVGRPEEAEAMFDVLTYQKGGAVLRMLEQYLGPDTFRRGIARYLLEHRYANTVTSDLWDALEAVSGEPVRATMDSWIYQGGYPLISVALSGDRCSLALEQRRFRYDGAPSDERWAIPVTVRVSVGGEVRHQRLLVDGETATVGFDGPVDWAVVNDGAWGYYRVRYQRELAESLANDLCGICNPPERMSLLVDTWAAVVAGAADLDDWIGLVGSLGEEDDPDVWGAVLGPLGLLALMVPGADQPAVAAFTRRVAGPAFARLGWEPVPGESVRVATARSRLLGALGTTGADPAVRAEVATRFARYLDDHASMPPDLLSAVVTAVVAAGGEPEWSTMLEHYRAASTPQDKTRYLYALGETHDPALLGRTLELCLGAEVRTQDAPFVVIGIMGRRPGGRLAWEWLAGHWNQVRDRFPDGMVARMLEGIPALVDPDLAAQVHAFLAGHEIPLAGPRLAQLEERMDINVALATRLSGQIATTLA